MADLRNIPFSLRTVTRIIRVIAQPRGNMLLIGIGGSGRQSLSRLSAYIIGFKVFQIEVTKHYRKNEFREGVYSSIDREIFNCVENNPGLDWFCFTTLCDWSRKLAPPSQPIRCKTKTNRDLVTHVFPRLRLPVTCAFFEFPLAPCDIYLCYDWPL